MTPGAAEEERAMLLGGWASFLTLTSYESPLGHHHLNKNNAERDITQLRLVVEKKYNHTTKFGLLDLLSDNC